MNDIIITKKNFTLDYRNNLLLLSENDFLKINDVLYNELKANIRDADMLYNMFSKIYTNEELKKMCYTKIKKNIENKYIAEYKN
jgi:hypothetical protein